MSSKVCQHCGEPIPAHFKNDSFCCHGCAHAYKLLNEMGLGSYYEKRTFDDHIRPLIPEEAPKIDYSAYTEGEENIRALHFMVDGLHCAACVWVIEHILERQPGVTYARLNMTTRRLTVKWDQTKTTPEKFTQTVFELGYRLIPYNPEELKRKDTAEEKSLLICMAVAGFAAANVMLFSVSIWSGSDMGDATKTFMHWLSALIALPAIAFSGRPFFKAAKIALKQRRFTMEVPISLAIILAALLSVYQTIQGAAHAYYDSAIMLLFFLLIGRYLDKRMQTRALDSAENLLTLQASFATIKDKNGSKRIPIKSLKAGDILIVAKGEHIAADGVVTNGYSSTDNSMITGESLPQQVIQGTAVVGGCINLEGALEVRVTAVGDKTVLAELSRLVETSMQAKNKYVHIADKASRIYAPAVHLLALSTFLFWFFYPNTSGETAVIYAIAVLIVTCPCALALAVPSAQVAASSYLLKQGVILKSGSALERLKDIDTVVFDKTGTLTEGNFKLITDDANSEDLRIAASLAVCSSHPLAYSLVQAVNPQTKAAPNVKEIPGKGLQTTILNHTVKLGSRDFCGIAASEQTDHSELWLKTGEKEPVCFLFEGVLRAEATQAVQQFQEMGFDTILLSGDHSSAVKAVAQKVGIKTFFAHQKPQDKQGFLKHLQEQGRKTLMIGDGLNDTPSLATAHVGMTLASAADLTRVHADIILQNNHLLAAPLATKFASRVHHIIKMNFAFSIAYNSIAVPVAIAGYITPLLAALFMSTSSITVMLNSLRLAITKQGR